MLRAFCRAKIHMARITGTQLEYDGSIEIDQDIMDAAGILPWEKVQVLNLENGNRLWTYVIPGKRGSGDIILKGPAARKGMVGDRVIIISYVYCTADEWGNKSPIVVKLDEKNRIIG